MKKLEINNGKYKMTRFTEVEMNTKKAYWCRTDWFVKSKQRSVICSVPCR